MRAIVYHGNKNIEFKTDQPEPTIQHPLEVKLAIDYCGVCGSDLHEYLDGPIFFKPEHNFVTKVPSKCQVMGHEITGRVVEIGDKVTSVKPGDHVVVEALGTCKDRLVYDEEHADNQCGACHDGDYNACDHISFHGLGYNHGAFADYMIAGEMHLIKFDPKVIPVEIAALCEPLSVSWHAMRISEFKAGQLSLVLGAGPIGLATILCLKAVIKGSGQGSAKDIVVMEPALARRKLAESFGVTTFDPTPYNNDVDKIVEGVVKLSKGGLGFHRSYDCSGVPVTFETSIRCLRSSGHATNIAIWPQRPVKFFPMEVTLHQRSYSGSIGYTTVDFEQVVQAFNEGNLIPDEVRTLVTAVVPLEKGIDLGFKELIEHKDKHIKILITPKSVQDIESVQQKVK